jgi:hypothetical protein
MEVWVAKRSIIIPAYPHAPGFSSYPPCGKPAQAIPEQFLAGLFFLGSTAGLPKPRRPAVGPGGTVVRPCPNRGAAPGRFLIPGPVNRDRLGRCPQEWPPPTGWGILRRPAASHGPGPWSRCSLAEIRPQGSPFRLRRDPCAREAPPGRPEPLSPFTRAARAASSWRSTKQPSSSQSPSPVPSRSTPLRRCSITLVVGLVGMFLPQRVSPPALYLLSAAR